MQESRGPLKGAVSAQKALQESETEMRELLGGTEGFLDKGSLLALQANQLFFTKRKQKEIELVARPGRREGTEKKECGISEDLSFLYCNTSKKGY